MSAAAPWIESETGDGYAQHLLVCPQCSAPLRMGWVLIPPGGHVVRVAFDCPTHGTNVLYVHVGVAFGAHGAQAGVLLDDARVPRDR
jgi:hypothetical protein